MTSMDEISMMNDESLFIKFSLNESSQAEHTE